MELDITKYMSSDWTDGQWDEYYADENSRHSIYRGIDGKVYFYIGD